MPVEQGAQHIVTVGFELGARYTRERCEANPRRQLDHRRLRVRPRHAQRPRVGLSDRRGCLRCWLPGRRRDPDGHCRHLRGRQHSHRCAIFLDGFARGVAHYNEAKGADVQVVGWDIEAQDGILHRQPSIPPIPQFVRLCESILDEGADIMLPVGGAINLPCGTAIQDRGLEAALIGVDADAFEAMPEEYQDLWLVTIEKGIAIQVQRSIEDHACRDVDAGRCCWKSGE